MAKRKALSKKVRFEVFKRDCFACQYCGAKPPNVLLEVDHIIAVADGGDNSIENLVTACQPCNSGKGARPLTAVPKSIADKTEEIYERMSQARAYSEAIQLQEEQLESDSWRVARKFSEHWGKDTIREDWFLSIRRFVKMLGVWNVLEAADSAILKCCYGGESGMFRYFCGICWGMAREARIVK